MLLPKVYLTDMTTIMESLELADTGAEFLFIRRGELTVTDGEAEYTLRYADDQWALTAVGEPTETEETA